MKTTLSFLSAATLLLGTSLAFAQPANLISNGDFAKDSKGWVYNYLGTQIQEPVIVDAAPTEGITRAFQAKISPEVEPNVLKTYSMTIRQQLGREVKAGEVFKASFWARSPESGQLAILFGTTEKGKRGFLFRRVDLVPQWKKYEVKATAKEDMPATSPNLEFHLALQPGTVELTGIHVSSEAAPAAP